MSSKPTFLLVPGAWHLPAYFDSTIAYLSSHGYRSVAVTLPGVNSSPAVTSIEPDVDAVAAALAALLKEGSDVVVMLHSYGGMVGTDAVGKVLKEYADVDGIDGKKSGKVRRLIYVAAYVPLEGQTLGNATDGAVEEPPTPPNYLQFEGPYITLNEHAPDAFYHDVSKSVTSQYVPLLGKQPAATFATPVTHAGWRSVQSTYVYARQDRPLPLPYQEFMVKRAQKEASRDGPVRPFDGEIGQLYIDSGHIPFLSMPEKLGEILIRAAETI